MKKTLLAVLLFTASSYFKLAAQALPAAYTQTTIVSGLQYPTDFDWSSDGRYFVNQKGGNATGSCANGKILVYSSSGTLLSTFYDLTDSVNCDFERGLLGIALDPNFNNNHYVYVYYVHKWLTANSCRILRFTENNNVGTNPTIIMDISVNGLLNVNGQAITIAGNHFGGIIRFRPSQPDKIYVQIGDLAYTQTTPSTNMGNKLNYPFGKILRINSDGTIPTDNPFYDDGNPATGNDDRIWTYGNRNGFGMCFNPVTDSMYFSENGLNQWDEYNICHKGGNYGWATCEGNFMNSSTTTPCNLTGDVRPMATWGAPLGGVTGTLFYSGTVMPEFDNHILVGDNDYGRIYDLTLGNPPAYDTVISNVIFADVVSVSSGGLTTMRQGTDGCIYAMKGGYTISGTIFKICHAPVGVATNPNYENIIGQNYPNPTTGKTQIDFSINQTSSVSIDLYDVTGRKVKTIYNAADVPAGNHSVELSDLSSFTAGSYFYKMAVKQNNKLVFSETKRMLLVH